MNSKKNGFALKNRLNIIIGGFGSGKTEFSVNLAIECAQEGKKVSVADLDIANPYFRSREVKDVLKTYNIDTVAPTGQEQFSDLPIVLPRIKDMIRDERYDFSIFDVGGDSSGARVLSSFYKEIVNEPYSMNMVINTSRPFSQDVSGCLKMKESLEQISRLSISGLILNTHLLHETDADIINQGIEVGLEVSKKAGLDILCICVMDIFKEKDKIRSGDIPLFIMKRKMLPPWLRKKSDGKWPLVS